MKQHLATFRIKGTINIFALAYNRVVIGGQGAYIEFEESHIAPVLVTKPGQEYRGTEKYKYCKYFHLMPHPRYGKEIKVYHQRGQVNYADYKVGKYYVSVDELEWDADIKLYAETSMVPNPTTINSHVYQGER